MVIILDFYQNYSARNYYYVFKYDVTQEVMKDVIIQCQYFNLQTLLHLACEKCLEIIDNPILRRSERRHKEDLQRWEDFADHNQISMLKAFICSHRSMLYPLIWIE